jgi:FHS family glucose/mannose:H+ symporter-like MFS transporter
VPKRSPDEPIAADSSVKPFRTLFPVFLYFVAAGIATVMLGPLLPALIQRWHIQDAQAGTLFTASFAGQLCGSWFGTHNLRASVLFGSAITAAGCIAMAWAGFGTAHVTLFFVGLGIGAGLTAGNVIAGTVVPSARARLIAVLNVGWGLGAIACPFLIRLCSPNGVQRFFFITAALLGISSLASIAIPLPETAELSYHPMPESSSSSRLPLPPRTLFAFAAALTLYIGVENALGGWLPSYAIRTNPVLHASSIAIYFWVAELTGRVVVTAAMSLISEAFVYRTCLTLLIVSQILLCVTANISPAGIITLTVLSALGLAPLYPIILSFLLSRTGKHPRLGSLIATASLGGATLPWLTGIVSTQFHGLRAGLIVPAVGAVLLFLCSATLKPQSVDSLQNAKQLLRP